MRGGRGTIASGLSLDCKEGLIPNVTFAFAARDTRSLVTYNAKKRHIADLECSTGSVA